MSKDGVFHPDFKAMPWWWEAWRHGPCACAGAANRNAALIASEVKSALRIELPPDCTAGSPPARFGACAKPVPMACAPARPPILGLPRSGLNTAWRLRAPFRQAVIALE